ncbi:MAG: hypothetical protein H6672_17060 [Anaerolineaceae bacterium]|nr:hypothetical protein [Anaerolineaceae bacterium]
MLKKFLMILMIGLFIPALSASAQQQIPDPVNAALNDLSSRVGRTLTIGDLQNWTWAQSVYPDASLGCPQPGMSYIQVQTGGFKFVLTYNNVQYDYRVSNDQRIVILCNSDSAPASNPAAVCPPPGDAGYITPRLSVGIQGQVVNVGDSIPNNVRSIPGTSGTYLGEIPPGGVFAVLEGPQCSQVDKLVWWRVDYNGLVGWTVEGKVDNGESDYWLEPVDARLIPPVSIPIAALSPANASQIQTLSNFVTPLGINVFSPNGKLLASGGVDGQLTLLNTETGATVMSVLAHPASVTGLAFSPDSKLLATSSAAGQAQLWTVNQTGVQVLFPLQGHTGSVDTLAFSPAGDLLATGSADGRVILWNVNLGLAAAQLTGQTGAITRLAFSDDGSLLLVTDSGGTTRVWGIPSAGTG